MFANEMKNTLIQDPQFNVSVTENAAIGYRTTGKALLDLNFKVASLRKTKPLEIIDLFMNAYFENKLLAIKWLFYVRDAREGLGERRLFRIIAQSLCNHHPDVLAHLIKFIPEYGRFDDLWLLLDTPHKGIVLDIIKRQQQEDTINMNSDKPISLMAKWLPSVNTSSADTRARAKQIRLMLGLTEEAYRKELSLKRRYLNVVEVDMSAKQWGEISYEAVPSRANVIYNNAFLRNDEERRRAYLGALTRGEAKINASVLFPHDIVHKYMNSGGWSCSVGNLDPALEGLWKALPDIVKGNGNTIVVADGSASMTTGVGGTNVMALSVANALAIYFAERSEGQFKDMYITFSASPKLVDFSQCASLREKIEVALRHNEVANTNIEAVFDLILSTALRGNIQQEELPQTILIVSDMEFDSHHCTTTRNRDPRMFSQIAAKYAQHGYQLPRLVFWNVNSRTGTIPVIENNLGVALVSGFSVNIVKMVLSGKLDAYECLVEQLLSPRYDPITLPVI